MSDKIQSFILENTWSPHSIRGWGNGYLALPKSNSWYGVRCESIPLYIKDTHGLTYSDYAKDFTELPTYINKDSWIIGFDSNRDSQSHLTKENIELLTYEMLVTMESLPDLQNKVTSLTNCTYCGFPHDVSDTLSNEYYEREAKKLTCFMCNTEFYYIG